MFYLTVSLIFLFGKKVILINSKELIISQLTYVDNLC